MRAPHQGRYTASPEIPFGLMANLVAKRCGVLESAEQIELIYFLQYLSHQDGGMKAVVLQIIDRFRERIATRTMLEIGCNDSRSYNMAEVAKIQSDIRCTDTERTVDYFFYAYREHFVEDFGFERDLPPRPKNRAQLCSAKEFKDECEAQAKKHLQQFLEELCLDPKQKVEAGPWYFPALIPSLFEFQREYCELERKSYVQTELANLVHETLDYSLHGNCLTLIDGRARTGKTFAAKKWIAPGKARFIEFPQAIQTLDFFGPLVPRSDSA